MSKYVDSVKRAPKTMTADEQRKFLAASGTHRDGFRDHCLFAFALGTALREHEIAALTVGDITTPDGRGIRRRFPLRVFKRSKKGAPEFQECQEAILPDQLRYKLEKYLRWKKANEESLAPDAALFVSRKGAGERPLTTRAIRARFAEWQERAGLERRFTFHQLRHSALTNLYRATKDIRLVQRVARHASVATTMEYTHPSDEDILRAVRAQPC